MADERPAPGPAKPPPIALKAHAPGALSARRWRSADLFGPAQEIEIEHGHAVYRLRLTSLGKLILTK
jgi:hemin uptake protein HemP